MKRTRFSIEDYEERERERLREEYGFDVETMPILPPDFEPRIAIGYDGRIYDIKTGRIVEDRE